MFKVGDKVRRIKSASFLDEERGHLEIGDIATVSSVSLRGDWLNLEKPFNISGNGFDSDYFELVEEEEEMYKYIILFIGYNELCKSIEDVQNILSHYPYDMEEIEVWELGRKAKVDYRPTVTFPSIG